MGCIVNSDGDNFDMAGKPNTAGSPCWLLLVRVVVDMQQQPNSAGAGYRRRL